MIRYYSIAGTIEFNDAETDIKELLNKISGSVNGDRNVNLNLDQVDDLTEDEDEEDWHY